MLKFSFILIVSIIIVFMIGFVIALCKLQIRCEEIEERIFLKNTTQSIKKIKIAV